MQSQSIGKSAKDQ